LISGQDLVADLQSKFSNISKAIDALYPNGVKKATAEREYRVALAKEILKMRASGMPVSIIGDVCRGDDYIADLKMARDIAESNLDANKEAIMAWKLEAKSIEEQISREWGRRE